MIAEFTYRQRLFFLRLCLILILLPFVMYFVSCTRATTWVRTTTTTFGAVPLATLTTEKPPVPLVRQGAPGIPPVTPAAATTTFRLHGFTIAGFVLLLAAGVLCLIRESRRWAAVRMVANQRWCDGCGFDLVGLDCSNCPECGEAIPGTVLTRTEPRKTVPKVLLVVWLLCLLTSMFFSPVLSSLSSVAMAYNSHVVINPTLPCAGFRDLIDAIEGVYRYLLRGLILFVLLPGAVVYVVLYLRQSLREDTK